VQDKILSFLDDRPELSEIVEDIENLYKLVNDINKRKNKLEKERKQLLKIPEAQIMD